MYDVYLTTGGVKSIGGGSDVWIRYWLDHISPHLKVQPVLMIDRPDPFPEVEADVPDHVKVVFRNDEQKWWDLLRGSDRIHILHMYYHEQDSIKRNLHKVNSIALHVCTEQSIRAAKELGLPSNKFHHIADENWEKSIIPHIPNPIWIGVNRDTPFHRDFDHIIDIPNLYVFEHERDLVNSDRVGFAARVENRKCLHYLEGLDSECFTSVDMFQRWRRAFDHDLSRTKVYNYSWKYIDRFYSKPSWGIFHGCYRAEPFGYSIFQAVDHGKLPILETDWDPDLAYPFRANDAASFREHAKKIRSMSTGEREEVLMSLRTYLKETYGRPEPWIQSYLNIYNV